MSRTDVSFAMLHTPLFLAGTNLEAKLDPTKRTGLVMAFDEEKKRLMVTWNGKTASVPETNVAMFIEGSPNAIDKIVPVKAVPFTAQASSPQDHVFAGPGGGKTK